VRHLFKKYCKSDKTLRETTGLDDQVRDECTRQAAYLRETATDLRQRAERNVLLNKKDEAHRVEENQNVVRYVY
jgi:hypothetical protein